MQAKHGHLDVQRVAIRCLGLFGLLERKPSKELVMQLTISFASDLPPISIMACKALIDVAMWHGPQEVDKALGQEHVSQFEDSKNAFNPEKISDADSNVELLDLLYAGLDRNDWAKSVQHDENETVQAILCEGFAKILLLSEKYSSLPTSLHSRILAKLIILYFSNETNDLQRWNVFVHCFDYLSLLS